MILSFIHCSPVHNLYKTSHPAVHLLSYGSHTKGETNGRRNHHKPPCHQKCLGAHKCNGFQSGYSAAWHDLMIDSYPFHSHSLHRSSTLWHLQYSLEHACRRECHPPAWNCFELFIYSLLSPLGETFWILGVLQIIFYFFHARLREIDMRFAVWHSEFIGAVWQVLSS